MLVAVLGACTGATRPPVDDADEAPRADATLPPPPTSAPRAVAPFVAATFDVDRVAEASGVASSVRNPGVVYVLDDGPGATGVDAVDVADRDVRAGHDRSAIITVEGLHGRDTEALAVARCGPRDRRSCLFVGDIGNNQGAWPDVEVWRVPEPALDGRTDAVAVPGRSVTLAYPDAPVDAEALLVADGRPFLVTKPPRDATTGEAPPPRLLAADAFADGTLRDLGTIPLPAPERPFVTTITGNVVTGGDRLGDRVVLRTYDHVVAYAPPTAGAPLRTLATWTPTELAAPRVPQGEAVGLDACGVWLVSEGVDSIWLVPWTDAAPAAGVDDDRPQEHPCPTGSARS